MQKLRTFWSSGFGRQRRIYHSLGATCSGSGSTFANGVEAAVSPLNPYSASEPDSIRRQLARAPPSTLTPRTNQDYLHLAMDVAAIDCDNFPPSQQQR